MGYADFAVSRFKPAGKIKGIRDRKLSLKGYLLKNQIVKFASLIGGYLTT